MELSNLTDDPAFKAGLVVGMAMAHAQKHVDETYPGMGIVQKGGEIERMTNLILFDLLEKQIKL